MAVGGGCTFPGPCLLSCQTGGGIVSSGQIWLRHLDSAAVLPIWLTFQRIDCPSGNFRLGDNPRAMAEFHCGTDARERYLRSLQLF